MLRKHVGTGSRLVHKHCHRTKTRCTWNYWANCNRQQINRDRNRVPFPHSLDLRLSSPSYYGLLCNKLSFYPHRFIKSARFSLPRARAFFHRSLTCLAQPPYGFVSFLSQEYSSSFTHLQPATFSILRPLLETPRKQFPSSFSTTSPRASLALVSPIGVTHRHVPRMRQCYRAQLVLRVRPEQAPFLLSFSLSLFLAPSALVLLPPPVSWLSACFPSFFHLSSSLYPCPHLFSQYRAQLVLRVRHQVPIFSFSFFVARHRNLPSHFSTMEISIPFFVPLFPRFLSIQRRVLRLLHDERSSCRAYATIKHLLPILFQVTVCPCCCSPGSIFLRGFRLLLFLFFLLVSLSLSLSLSLAVALLSSAN